MPKIVSGLKRNGCPGNPGNGGWIAPEYALLMERSILIVKQSEPTTRSDYLLKLIYI
ncbi:hypothetical protein [Vibrio diazotrophicus]|uniref:hypothetical protein n=1 Tax=Vibrio diazotrophicus TaxID=685 RepID=UPI0012E093D0|nr:hypothetical protein [Vibrio diazotrophicus]